VRARASLLLILFVAQGVARADESSGSVSGEVEARTTTFHEQRTEIIAPTIGGRLDFPNGMRARGQYLVDVITSSSVAVDIVASASVGVDPLAHAVFHERRNEGSLAVGGSLPRTQRRLDLDGTLRYSHEPDYQSYSGGFTGSYALSERSTLLRFGSTYSRDYVFQAQRTTDPTTGETTVRIVRVEEGYGFDSVVVQAGMTRVLSPFSELDVGYEFGFLSGYLGNPYRRVIVDGFVERERVPTRRIRHTASAAIRLARPRARGALHLAIRGYADDWSILAFSGEARWYQRIGPFLVMRSRFRYYEQTAAAFDSGQDVNAPSYPIGTNHTTANPRYAAMRSFEMGGAFVTRLGFLGRSDGRIDQAEVELAFDYRLSSNRFGDAITAVFALRVPIP